MGLYSRHVLPRLIDGLCGLEAITEQRRKVVPHATGVVLEVGIGSGLNLPLYDPERVTRVIGVDPDDAMWRRSARRRSLCPFPIERIGLSGEEIPLETGCAETVLVTYALCTIPDPRAALTEMRRVLRPGGRLLFLEHGEAPAPAVRRWQQRIAPLWRRIAGGCHPDRPILRLIEDAGWRTECLEQGYIKGPKPLTYNYWGWAKSA